MAYRQRGAGLIVFPGAFNMTTGPVHWQLLQQARAVDNQLFIASCSPARNLDSTYTAWGHSMIVDPFGEVRRRLKPMSFLSALFSAYALKNEILARSGARTMFRGVAAPLRPDKPKILQYQSANSQYRAGAAPSQ